MDELDSVTEHEEAGQNSRLSISVSIDKDGFLRRTCPSCGRDFKTDVKETELAEILAPTFSRLGAEIGDLEIHSADVGDDDRLTCPFCGHGTASSEALPEDLLLYIRRILLREIMLPVLDRTFGSLAGELGGSPGRNSFFSVRFDYSRGMLPARPIHGPEPRDMKTVVLLCCGRRFKVSESWYDIDVCPYCETAIRLS